MRAVTASGGEGRAGAGRFGWAVGAKENRSVFSWFVPELLRHKNLWRDILLASLAIQLVGPATPLFTQVIIDKRFPSSASATSSTCRRSRSRSHRSARQVVPERSKFTISASTIPSTTLGCIAISASHCTPASLPC
jgi:hypothetical protein